MDLSERRLAASFAGANMPQELGAAAKVVMEQLPHEERQALKRAGQIFLAEQGAGELPRGELEQKAYWSALYRGFEHANICSWSHQPLSDFVTADIFADKLDALLRRHGVDTGSPSIAHTDLIVALVRVAAGLPSNNSFKPIPLR